MASGNRGRQELARQDHVARYCRGRHVREDGKILADAFILREQETYLSTNWLENFHPADRAIQLAGVRQTLRDKGFRLARAGHFVALNVGAAIDRCRQGLSLEIQFINLGEERDPSHTGIYGLETNVARAARILAEAVSPAEVYPAG